MLLRGPGMLAALVWRRRVAVGRAVRAGHVGVAQVGIRLGERFALALHLQGAGRGQAAHGVGRGVIGWRRGAGASAGGGGGVSVDRPEPYSQLTSALTAPTADCSNSLAFCIRPGPGGLSVAEAAQSGLGHSVWAGIFLQDLSTAQEAYEAMAASLT